MKSKSGKLRAPARLLTAFAVAAALGLAGAAPAQADLELGPPSSECVDLRFIGAKGSGQTGTWGDLGREMATLEASLRAQLPQRFTTSATALNYPAYGTELVFPGFSLGLYLEGVREGVDELHDLLDRIEEHCPDERVVLAGYSSGAMVVHTTLVEIDDDVFDRAHWGSRIAGVHLLADPRRKGDDPVNAGNASDATNGIASWQWANSEIDAPSRIPELFAGVTRSWCTTKDPICDWNPAWVATKARHSEYGINRFPNLFADEATRLTTKWIWTFPDDDVPLPTVARTWPVNKDLRDGFVHAPVFTTEDQIPGLTLSRAGVLSGFATEIGDYEMRVRAETKRGFAVTFTVRLSVVDPIEMVPFDTEPIIVRTPRKVRLAQTLPTVPAGAVVGVDPDRGALPAPFKLSAGGKITGTSSVVGSHSFGVRIATRDGGLRRAMVRLSVTNAGRLVTDRPDGTPSNAAVEGGLLLSRDRVAFLSTAGDLGVDNPDERQLLHLRDLASGTRASWVPPEGESICAVTTDDTRAQLFVVTEAWIEFVNENGDPDGRSETSIYSAPIDGPLESGDLPLTPRATLPIGCDSRAFAASSVHGFVVISDLQLDQPDPAALEATTRSLYQVGPAGQLTRLASPPGGPRIWRATDIVDVQSDGGLLVRHESADPSAPWRDDEAYFLYDIYTSWNRVDLGRREVPVELGGPRFYQDGIVYSGGVQCPQGGFAARAAIQICEKLHKKPFAAKAPALFGMPIWWSGGIEPLTPTQFATGCLIATRSATAARSSTEVLVGDTIVDSCIADPATYTAASYPVGTGGAMLVAGELGGAKQLFVADVP